MRTSVCHVVIKPHKSDSLPAITKRTFHDVVSLKQSTETAAASTNTKALDEIADQKWQTFFIFLPHGKVPARSDAFGAS